MLHSRGLEAITQATGGPKAIALDARGLGAIAYTGHRLEAVPLDAGCLQGVAQAEDHWADVVVISSAAAGVGDVAQIEAIRKEAEGCKALLPLLRVGVQAVTRDAAGGIDPNAAQAGGGLEAVARLGRKQIKAIG